MQCCHYYCRECVKAMLRASKDPAPYLSISCPECHSSTPLPDGDPDKLPSARFMSRLKSVYARVNESTKLDVICGQCSEKRATGFCHRCAYFICARCVHTHDPEKEGVESSANHSVQVRKMKEENKAKMKIRLDKYQAKETEKEKKIYPKKCENHDDDFRFYCFDCDSAICYDCTLADHKGHTFQLLKQAVAHCRQFLNDSLATLKEAKKASEVAIQKSTGKKAEAILKKVYSNAEIVETIQRLQARIEDRKCELLSQVESVAQQKIDNIEVQRKSISATSTKIEHLVKFVEDNLQSASDAEFAQIHQLMMDRIEEERKKLHLMKMEPPENFEGLKTDPSEYAIEISSSEAKLLEFDMIARNCTVTGDNLTTAEMSVPVNATLQTLYRKGFICSEPQDIDVHVYTFVGNCALPTSLVKKTMGKYDVSFTPESRGQHTLEVTVNGAHANGSPFIIFAEIPPSKLGIPVKVIPDLKLPFAVATQFRRTALISECMSSELRTCTKLETKCGGEIKHASLLYPRGLAVDDDDNLLVANTGHHNIVKLDTKGCLLTVVGKEGNGPTQFSYPMDIAVSRSANRTFVCDAGNERIQIFDRELEYLKSITASDLKLSKPSFEDLAGVACDERSGDVYVTDRGLNRVHVLNKDGELRFTFGADASGEFELDKPTGICVFRQHIFVSEIGSNRISIFEKSDGKFVRCFGVLGEVEGCLHWPFRMALDRQGFLHVCDCLNNRVQIF